MAFEESGQEVARVSPIRQYRQIRSDGCGRLLSAFIAVFVCLLWIVLTGTTKWKIPIENEDAEAARRRAAGIEDWSEVVDRDR